MHIMDLGNNILIIVGPTIALTVSEWVILIYSLVLTTHNSFLENLIIILI